MQAFDALPLHTPRLLLRPLAEGDAEALFAMYGDPVAMRYWATPPWTDLDKAHAMIARDLQLADRSHLRLALVLPAPSQLIGTCTLFGIDTGNRRAEIGYMLRTDAWGQGYMREALTALLDYGFERLALNRVEADIDPRNDASARILERLGFVKEGHLRERWVVAGEVSDTGLYGLLRRDWRATTTVAPDIPSGA